MECGLYTRLVAVNVFYETELLEGIAIHMTAVGTRLAEVGQQDKVMLTVFGAR